MAFCEKKKLSGEEFKFVPFCLWFEEHIKEGTRMSGLKEKLFVCVGGGGCCLAATVWHLLYIH